MPSAGSSEGRYAVIRFLGFFELVAGLDGREVRIRVLMGSSVRK